MYCENCDIHFEGGDYCPECGTKIEEPTKVQPVESSLLKDGILSVGWLLFIYLTFSETLYFNSWIAFWVIGAIGTFLLFEFRFKERSLKGKISTTFGVMILIYLCGIILVNM